MSSFEPPIGPKTVQPSPPSHRATGRKDLKKEEFKGLTKETRYKPKDLMAHSITIISSRHARPTIHNLCFPPRPSISEEPNAITTLARHPEDYPIRTYRSLPFLGYCDSSEQCSGPPSLSPPSPCPPFYSPCYHEEALDWKDTVNHFSYGKKKQFQNIRLL